MSTRYIVVRFLLASALLLPCAGSIRGQSVFVPMSDPDAIEFPIVSATFYALDSNGLPIRDLLAEDFSITENGQNRTVLEVRCPEIPPPDTLSLVLTYDISASMDRSVGRGETRLDVAKKGTLALLREMNLAVVECAITSFASVSALNQDFTSDRSRLERAIESLMTSGSTDHEQGLIGWPGGGLTVASRGKHRRVLVYITDGSVEGDPGPMIAAALQYGVEVYCVTIATVGVQYLDSLSSSTGGLYFGGLSGVESLRGVFHTVLNRTQGIEPCTITWRSAFGCEKERSVEIAAPARQLAGSLSYVAPDGTEADFHISPERLSFGAVVPGNRRDLPVMITFQGGAVNVTGIRSDNPMFEVVELETNPAMLPRTFTPRDTLRLTLRFTPVDSTFVAGRILVSGDVCSDAVLHCTGGFGRDTGGVPPTVRLTHPNGGEEFPIGIDTVLAWDGVLPSDPVRLEYSIDDGSTWERIAEDATGLSFSWRIPDSPSRRCLARVRQMNPHQSIRFLQHPESVLDVRFLPGGDRVVTLSDGGTLRIWSVESDLPPLVIPGDGPAFHLEVSPDGLHAATGGGPDGGVSVWDLRGLKRLYRLPASYSVGSGSGLSMRSPLYFTPDGATLVTAKVENPGDAAVAALRLVDAGSGVEYRDVRDVKKIYRCGAVSPDGQYCAAGGAGGAIQIWDRNMTRIVRSLVDPNGDVVRLSFRTDSDELLSVAESPGGGMIMSRWSVDMGIELGSTPLPDRIVDVDAASHADVVLLTDSEAWIGELGTGDMESELPGHAGHVHAARYGPDGTLLATAGDDMTARIWKIDPDFAREDVSDARWSIVAPNVRSRDVDFGTVGVGSNRDSTLAGFIHTIDPYSVLVTGMRITGRDASDFAILSDDSPFWLVWGEPADIELSFGPSATGRREAFIEIETTGGTLIQRLHGTGVDPALKIVGLVGDFIDFGPVPVGGSRVDSAWGVNVGSSPLNITALTHRGPDDRQFIILSPDVSASLMLPPGDSIKVVVRFQPARTGFTQGGIGVAHDGDGSPAVIGLLGEGIAASDPAIAAPAMIEYAPQICVATGDTMTVEIGNRGSALLTISDATIEGMHATDFRLAPAFVPLSIPPEESRTLRVVFAPTDDGDRTARLRLVSNASNAPELFVDLHGRLERAELSVDPSAIDLGRLCSEESGDVTVLLRNAGEAGTGVRATILNQSGGTVELPLNAVPVAAADSSSTTLRFRAGSDAGPFRVEVALVDTLCGSTERVVFAGEIDMPDVTVDSVGSICAGQTVALRATGAERYEWSPPDGLSCADCAEPIAGPDRTTTYVVTGYDADGCAGIDSVLVHVRQSPTVVRGAIDRRYRARSGDTARVAIELKDGAPELSELDDLEIELRYDPLVMRVDVAMLEEGLKGTLLEGWQVVFVNETSGRLRIRLERGTGVALTGPGVLLHLACRPFLSKVPGTEVELSVGTSGRCVEFTTTSGYVGVDSLCGLSYRLFAIALAKTALGDVRPNPVRGGMVTIPFSVAFDGEVRLEVYDGGGRRVALLAEGYLESGWYGVDWDASGIGSGEYHYRLTSGDRVETRRFVVVR